MALPAGIKAEAVRPALAGALATVPPSLRRSLTWDRGREMASYAELIAQTGCAVYFCDPFIPWQRGLNENRNRLLRQYLSKTADLGSHDQQALDTIAARLNARPRKVLAWRSLTEVFADHQTRPRPNDGASTISEDQMPVVR